MCSRYIGLSYMLLNEKDYSFKQSCVRLNFFIGYLFKSMSQSIVHCYDTGLIFIITIE